ncbi:MAG: succinate dehydrogenase assembly factor 2 [Betaproteobacteria bacterium]|nr:succinate dehydrogenase assembly factor 2 [Betaproteobacteria bacterium]
MPHDHELRRCLPKGAESDQSDRQDQGNHGEARRVGSGSRGDYSVDPQSGLSAEDWRRLRWHCRRGLLENDLVLEKFLVVHGPDLDQGRLARLRELLELGDNALWDLVCGRIDPAAEHAEIVGWLRSC